MKVANAVRNRIAVLILLVTGTGYFSFSQQKNDEIPVSKIEKEIQALMKEGDIPGLSLVIIKNGRQQVRNYGYSDVEQKKKVTSTTLFQLASCSKAFTALAITKLIDEGSINPDVYITEYIPWFRATYEDSLVNITIRQLLHHTSGIPWRTISAIPKTNSDDALEQTIKKISGIELSELPGKQYEYATINYDILALILEKVTGKTFEKYIQENIIEKLQLQHTRVGTPADSNSMSVGYKISFYKAREYNAPVYKGNNAAGYIISDAADMARWLKFQLGLSASEMYPLAKQTHLRDETVSPQGLRSYAMGWQVSLSGNREISHSGLNPNFTSYVTFRTNEKTGVVVLANSNSTFTAVIGDRVMKLLMGEEIKKDFNPDNGNDTMFSIVTLLLLFYVLFITGFLAVGIFDIAGKKRKYKAVSIKTVAGIAASLLFIVPVLFGIYLFPKIMGFTWEAVVVWTPMSFITMVALIVAAIALSYMVYLLSLIFPVQYSYKKELPKIIMVSILSGIANMAIILLITSSFNKTIDLKYIAFYYLLTLMVYILGRKFVQTSLIRITRGLVYEIRIRLIEKIFSTSYQKFEKIDRGRVYSTLNDDVGTIGDSAGMIVGLVTSFITTVGAFLYLSAIAFWATIVAITLIVSISLLYSWIGKRTQVYYEEARDTRNVFMRLLNGMIDGFKEISLHRNKKIEYREDISMITEEFRVKTATADTRFVYGHLAGEAMLIILLGIIAFAMPEMFPAIEQYVIMSFVIVILYLNGPLNVILTSVPAIMRLKIAWNRIQAFLSEIPANLDLDKIPETINKDLVQSIKAERVTFTYKNSDLNESFSVGPVDFEVEKGQVLFIVGGNGSGKTTLAKLISGLYEPDNGKIFINNKEVKSSQLSEYFSAVFSPCHLFDKLYNVKVNSQLPEVKKYLELLGLTDKVTIEKNHYSTINLSGGQRKRLALLQCYLEDCPIYLFDEWTADQDPQYRRFFYRELLPEMKRKGKIIIAITHDDHYFDVADKILKMDMGRVEYVSNDFKVDEVLSN